MVSVAAAVLGGLVAGVISPILLRMYERRDREMRWAKPRKDLLKGRLESAKGQGWVSLERLMIVSGTNKDDCRSLLMEVDARGGWMKSKKEAWALISKQPLTNSGEDIEDADQ